MKKEIDYRKLPYFETKVVKVKGHKHIGRFDPYENTVKCIYCGRTFQTDNGLAYHRLNKPKGNWVNGENLDKIKFPCFCSYKKTKNIRVMGIINRGYLDGYKYILTDINQQWDDANLENALYYDLKALIKDYDIHILKGKIIIFEEGK